MRISKELVQEFAKKGVSVRWYPEQNIEDFKSRVFVETYENMCKNRLIYVDGYNEGEDETHRWSATAFYKTVEEMQADCRERARNINEERCSAQVSEMLYIEYEEKLIMQKVSVKKEVTEEYLQKLIDKNEKAYSGAYGEFSIKMQKLIKAAGYGAYLSVYPTTYGIGVLRLYNWHFNEESKVIENILNKYGVEYYNELSEAGWVYRYKVSKKKDNLAKVAA